MDTKTWLATVKANEQRRAELIERAARLGVVAEPVKGVASTHRVKLTLDVFAGMLTRLEGIKP